MNLSEWTRVCHVGDRCCLGDVLLECKQGNMCSSCVFSTGDDKCVAINCSSLSRRDNDDVWFEGWLEADKCYDTPVQPE